ncbi:MAG: hypothetical protein ACOY58_02155 [Candidatus Micrarchaeota archaeon]
MRLDPMPLPDQRYAMDLTLIQGGTLLGSIAADNIERGGLRWNLGAVSGDPKGRLNGNLNSHPLPERCLWPPTPVDLKTVDMQITQDGSVLTEYEEEMPGTIVGVGEALTVTVPALGEEYYKWKYFDRYPGYPLGEKKFYVLTYDDGKIDVMEGGVKLATGSFVDPEVEHTFTVVGEKAGAAEIGIGFPMPFVVDPFSHVRPFYGRGKWGNWGNWTSYGSFMVAPDAATVNVVKVPIHTGSFPR